MMPALAPPTLRPRILVVEDMFLIADMIAEYLRDYGCDIVGPMSRLNRALASAEQEKLDGALLDVNIGGDYCFPIAAVLKTRGIPFAFLTGYDDAVLPPEYRDLPRLSKPFEVKELFELVSEQFARKV